MALYIQEGTVQARCNSNTIAVMVDLKILQRLKDRPLNDLSVGQGRSCGLCIQGGRMTLCSAKEYVISFQEFNTNWQRV